MLVVYTIQYMPVISRLLITLPRSITTVSRRQCSSHKEPLTVTVRSTSLDINVHKWGPLVQSILLHYTYTMSDRLVNRGSQCITIYSVSHSSYPQGKHMQVQHCNQFIPVNIQGWLYTDRFPVILYTPVTNLGRLLYSSAHLGDSILLPGILLVFFLIFLNPCLYFFLVNQKLHSAVDIRTLQSFMAIPFMT